LACLRGYVAKHPDLLGLHQTTAAKWMHQAGGDWSRYAAELDRSHPHQI